MARSRETGGTGISPYWKELISFHAHPSFLKSAELFKTSFPGFFFPSLYGRRERLTILSLGISSL